MKAIFGRLDNHKIVNLNVNIKAFLPLNLTPTVPSPLFSG